MEIDDINLFDRKMFQPDMVSHFRQVQFEDKVNLKFSFTAASESDAHYGFDKL